MKYAWGAVCLAAMVGALLLAGCGDEETPPACEYCQYWTALLDGFARYPAYSPDALQSDRIAFSSNRPAETSVVDEEPNEHIWVLDGEEAYRITNDGFNDFDPSWSPDGTRLAFTREADGRLDVWTVNVSDLAHPGAPVRLTQAATVTENASESSWLEMDGELWVVFSSGENIWRVHESGGTPVKLILDPQDVGGACGLEELPDFQPAVGPDGRVAFTSIGRTESGTLAVSGFISTAPGETTQVADAEIYLDGCNTGFRTPHTFSFLPVRPDQGTYTVAVESPSYCFRRTLYPVVRSNARSSVRFNFQSTAGDVYLWVYEANVNVYDIFEEDTTFFFRMGTGFPQPEDSVLRCLEAGEHVLLLEWNSFSRDTTVTVTTGETDSIFVFEAKNNAGRLLSSLGASRPLRSPAQTNLASVWVADLEEEEMVGIWSVDSQYEQACWSPTGRYLAFVASDPIRARWGVKVIDLESGSPVIRSIPLPGSSGSADCYRSAYHVSWNSAGDRLAVSMGTCMGDEDPQDLQVWVIDPRPFLGN